MTHEEHIQEFLALCRRIYDKGFVSGSGGNVSARIGEQILITPTGRSLGLLRKDDLVRLNADGTVSGAGRPSREWRMHLVCYARSDVAAVIHVHSFCAVALSCMKGGNPECVMPAYTPGYAVQVGRLPLLPYFRPGSEELAIHAGAVIAGRNSALLANHGVLAVGASLELAMNIIEEIEENAHLRLMLGDGAIPLDDEQQAELTECPS
jgi:ribulose-5-phosphate 4-epimerase/fuculose-1-phosphate aldolase